jgi:hypothetical protein
VPASQQFNTFVLSIKITSKEVMQGTLFGMDNLRLPVVLRGLYELDEPAGIAAGVSLEPVDSWVNITQHNATDLGSIATEELSLPAPLLQTRKRYLPSIATNQDSDVTACHAALADPVSKDRLVTPSEFPFP